MAGEAGQLLAQRRNTKIGKDGSFFRPGFTLYNVQEHTQLEGRYREKVSESQELERVCGALMARLAISQAQNRIKDTTIESITLRCGHSRCSHGGHTLFVLQERA